jgi:hypothetical protein
MRLEQLFAVLKETAADSCWTGYRRAGTKKKGGRTVPNCVPKNESMAEEINDDMPDLEAVGEPVKSTMDAERRMAAGDRIFVAHEMDEEPFEILNVDDLKGYTYDQMLAVSADMAESRDSKDLNTRYFLGKLQARHPQARDIESALAMDYMVSQRQDRRDITRLDLENDQEQAEIDDLQRSLDKLKSRGI